MNLCARNRDFTRNEQRKFANFCQDLEREYAILSDPAIQRQRTVDDHDDSDDSETRDHDSSGTALFDFKMHSLLKMERDFNVLMEENLKMDTDEVYKYLSTSTVSSSSSMGHHHQESDPPWALLNHRHEVLLKLPLNELGEMVSGRHSMHSLSTNTPRESPLKRHRAHSPPQSPLTLDDPPTPRRDSINESPTNSMTQPMIDGMALQSVDTVQIEEDSDDLLFEMDSDEEEDRSFLSTPPSSG